MSTLDTSTLVTNQPGYGNHAAEKELAAAGKVHLAQVPRGMRIWVVTAGVEEVKDLLTHELLSKDSDLLKSVIRAQLAETGQDAEEVELSGMFGRSMMYSDNEDHSRLRGLVQKSFTPSQVNRLKPLVERLTGELLASLPPEVPLDLVSEFTYKLPITVICEVLGLPVEDREQVHEWTSALVLDDPERTMPASRAMETYLEQQIARVRQTPDDGLICSLVNASVDGDMLTADELMAQLFLLVVGGHETTSGLIANTMYALLVQSERWRSVVADPALARAAVDETLRYDAPTRNTTHRVTLAPMSIGDTVVPKNAIVMASLSAAGRDAGSTADRPDEFDLHRADRRHLAFGHGPHNCLGRNLALLQAVAAVTGLAARFPNARLLDTTPPRMDASIVGGVAKLPVMLQ
ncbi:cytochrome P450 [Lentzea sp. NPDC059081]|uniref:cytochrome P450 n=1 Tax=Lentzea sp. NPDC059081 TaxID=3346719 RepID=UPI0036BB784F